MGVKAKGLWFLTGLAAGLILSLPLDVAPTGLLAASGAFLAGLAINAPKRLTKAARLRRANPIDEDMRWAIYRRDGLQCLSCGTPNNLTLDHIVPVSHGGKSTPKNLRTLCRSCNSRRGNRVSRRGFGYTL